MENFLFFLATSLALRIPSPKFQRYLLNTSGCSALLVAGNNTLHSKRTKDSDRLSFYNHHSNGVQYAMIMVQMKEVAVLKDAEQILIQYINRIRKPLGIACNYSMEVEVDESTITVTDYWQDAAGKDWKIKGLMKDKIMAVLYVRNIGDMPVKEHDTFLNGFRFSRFS